MAYSILGCPLEGCDFSARQEKRFVDHLVFIHNLEPEKLYVEHVLGGIYPTCECGCGNKTAWLGWKNGYTKLLRGHNARIYTAFSDPAVIEKCVQSRIDGHRMGRHQPWNTGLTATEDVRLANSHERASRTLRTRYASGELTSWQSGLTAESDHRLKKSSETKRINYASGITKSWSKGLNKGTSEILARTARKISAAYNARQMGKRLKTEEIAHRIGSSNFDLLEDDYRSRKGSRLRVKCRACGAIQERTLYSIESTQKCFACCPKETVGHAEILEFLRSLTPHVISEDRQVISPLELDIVVPSSKFAVEFNGLYWHSEIHRGKEYHSDKTAATINAGYKLIHIFEDEWRDRRPIVESMLRHRLGIPTRRIGARKCEIVKVESKERKNFFDLSHIDGDVSASDAWGLKLDGQLVACLSIRRPVHRKWNKRLEVARFAVYPGLSVSGALSRLSLVALAEARARGFEGLMSYVDTRYGDGAGYLASGYQLHSKTGPTFWWTDFDSRFNRFRYRADASRGLSEEQVAKEAGVVKVWGCDQLVMVL